MKMTSDFDGKEDRPAEGISRRNLIKGATAAGVSAGLSAPPGYHRPWQRLRGPDPRVQRITKNLLERFRA
jgi:hypothetical protein